MDLHTFSPHAAPLCRPPPSASPNLLFAKSVPPSSPAEDIPRLAVAAAHGSGYGGTYGYEDRAQEGKARGLAEVAG